MLSEMLRCLLTYRDVKSLGFEVRDPLPLLQINYMGSEF